MVAALKGHFRATESYKSVLGRLLWAVVVVVVEVVVEEMVVGDIGEKRTHEC